MAIDPRIPLMIRPPEIDQAGDAARRFMPMAQMLDANAMKRAYVWGPDGELDRNATIQNLSRINPGVALQLQNQLGLQDHWATSARLREEESAARLQAQREKLILNGIGKIKGNIANAWGAFTFQGPEAARQSYRQSQEPIWQALKMSPEQMDQATAGFTPENAEMFLSGQKDTDLRRMAERAVDNNGRLFWDSGEPAEGELIQAGGPVEPQAGPRPELPDPDDTSPEAAEGRIRYFRWTLSRDPETPQDWAAFDKIISVGNGAKWFKGSPQQLTTPFGVFQNPYWTRAEKQKSRLKIEEQKELLQEKARLGLDKGTTVNVGGTNVGKYVDKISEEDAKEVSKIRQRADDLDAFAVEARTIVDVLEGYTGGPWSEVQAKLGQYLPGTPWGRTASAVALVDAMRVRMAPLLRVPGSGATTDFEMRLYMQALPNLSQFKEGRELIARVLERAAERAATSADIRNELNLSGKYSAKEHRRRMKEEFGESILTPEELSMVRGKPSAAPKTPAAKPSVEGAPAAKQHAGKWYTAPDGSVYQSDGETWVLKGKK